MTKGADEMATTTFDKTIHLDKEAAERLADILEKPVPSTLKDNDTFWKENERKVAEWLYRSKK